jgi:GNAT superfamily N-acetyltransferase
MKIREYSPQDNKSLVRVNVDCRKHNYKWNVNQEYLDSISYDHRLQKRENKPMKWKILVAEIDWNVVWFIHWWKWRDWEDFPPYEIRWLYISPKHQWLWIGKKLFKALLDLTGVKKFYLWTLKNNSQSQWFYKKLWWIKFAEKTRKFWWYDISEAGYKW